MKNCVGQAVRGDDFFDRKNELLSIWDAIESGSNILLAAPRRVGKTSIMLHMQDSPLENYIVMYIDTESADSENEFWQKIFNALQEEDFINKLKSHAKTWVSKLLNIKIKKISASGVEFGDGKILDYSLAFEELVKDLDIDKKLIIMVDEFAQTVENIIEYENEKSAKSLLKTHRELRQNPKVSDKVTFLYAGSIGLESVVSKIQATKLINDLNSIKVSPLSTPEAKIFTSELCRSVKIELNKDVTSYLLEKVEWLIPFYIQLLIQEVKTLSIETQDDIDNNMIDRAINRALEHRNHFEHWQSKLKEAFSKDEYLFAKEILNIVSENITISSSQIINIGSKHSIDEDTTKEIIHTLVYDGYINNNDNSKVYRFNSPILRMWWYKNVAN